MKLSYKFLFLSLQFSFALHSSLALADPEKGNLDRVSGPQIIECNKNTAFYKKASFTMEAPIAQVRGSNLYLNFFFVGLACDQREGGLYAWRPAPPKLWDKVIIRNAAHSPIHYDWNIYKAKINPNLATNEVSFEMPLFEVMEDDQIALFKKGEIAQVKFNVFASAANAVDRGGYIQFFINLDPQSGEGVDISR